MILYGDTSKEKIMDEYRAKANEAGQKIFDALIAAQEWPKSVDRKTTEEADVSVSEIVNKLSVITERFSKSKSAETSELVLRLVNLAATHPELLPEIRYAAFSIKRW